jgi:hypothetical protein
MCDSQKFKVWYGPTLDRVIDVLLFAETTVISTTYLYVLEVLVMLQI